MEVGSILTLQNKNILSELSEDTLFEKEDEMSKKSSSDEKALFYCKEKLTSELES